MRIGLVLGAGGSVGVAFHGGVLSAICDVTGWDPRTSDVIVGTSAGSITASLLRAGVSARDLACISENRPLSEEAARLAQLGRPHRPRPNATDVLRMRAVADPLGVWHGLTHPLSHPWSGLVAALMPAGGISTAAISTGISAVFGGHWPAETLWICAVDLRSGRRVVFGAPGSPPADVGLAVAASSAIPAYFTPVAIGRRRYVDGGVRSMLNLDLLAGSGLDLVLVSSPLSHAGPVPYPTAGTFLRQALRARVRAEAAAVRRTGVPVVVVEPDRRIAAAMGFNPMDARRRGPVSRVTRTVVAEWLTGDAAGRELAGTLRSAGAAGEGAAGATG